MEVMDALLTRRSIRRFADIPIPMQRIGPILEAGRAAPSAGNLQTWKFIIVTEESQRKEIADACYQQFWMAKAPVIIVVVAEVDKCAQYYGARGEKVYSIQNTSAAVMSMLLAIHAQGLASCWVSAFDEGMVSRICGIPDTAAPHAILPIGLPDEKVPAPPRYNVEILTFFGSYNRRTVDKDWVLGHYSVYVEQALSKGKEFVEKLAKKLQ